MLLVVEKNPLNVGVSTRAPMSCLRGHQCRGRWIRAFSADLEDHGLMRVQRLVYGYIWKVVVIDKLTPIFGL